MCSKQYKVLHFIESDELYGAENVVLNLASEMSRHSAYKPVIGCITENGNAGNALCEHAKGRGIDALPVVISKNYSIAFQLLKSVRRIRQCGIHIIHTHGHKATIIGFIIHLLSGIPIIGTSHLWFDHAFDNPGNNIRYKLFVKLERILLKYFSFCICVSEIIQSRFLEMNPYMRNTLVIYNGIQRHVPDATMDKDSIRKELGIRNEYPIILNAGRLMRQKAQCDIISAASILKEKGVPVNVVIAGEGILRESLDKQIRDLDLGDVVKLVGFRNDMARLLGAADIFLLPSLEEGLPIALLEAMSARVPVIATPVGEVPKIIEHGVNGQLVPVNDATAIAAAIDRYVRDLPEAGRMSENAFQQFERAFSSSIMYEGYGKVYETVVANSWNGRRAKDRGC
jgi:glycosyltransferase involved in cell wall biosynthesis